MTHREKIELLQNTIVQLYEKEGRSKSYISRLLEVDRKVLSEKINEWGLVQAQVSRLTPSRQKWWNSNRSKVIKMLDQDIPINEISKEMGISRHSLVRTYIKKDKEALHHLNMFHHRARKRAEARKEEIIKSSGLQYEYEKIKGEKWADIKGYPGYQVSNKGRVRSYKKSYNRWALLSLNKNVKSGRMYVQLPNSKGRISGLSVARLVAFNFVEGHSEENNTVNHKDLDVTNNKAENLEWVSQSENNKHAYQNGREIVKGGQLLGKFKHIELDGKYRFKTVEALSRFLGKSTTQTYRYITGETPFDRDIKIVY